MVNLNPSQIGNITELKCQIYLIEHGWTVLIPQGEFQRYDLVIEKNNRFYKIQIKHASEEENGFRVRTKRDVREDGKVKKTTYSSDDVDYFMTEFNGEFYVFPIFGTKECKFWTEKTFLKSQKQAKDYQADIILSKL